jgi:L-malate glycosyltransferase
MKVAHIDEQTGWRGGEQQASWLIRGLVRRGHTVWVIGRPGEAFIENDHGGVSLHRVPLPLRGEWDLFSALRLARLIRREEIDILHAHSSHAHTIAVLARRLAGRGVVIVSRRVSFPPREGRFNRWKYQEPDRILCVSENVAEVLRVYGLPPQKIRTVCSSVDLARVEVPPLPRAELGVDENAPLLISAGALVPHKDHATLIDALPEVRRVFPDARLLIAGEGDCRKQIEERIAGLGLDDAVTLLGHRRDVPRLIRSGDVYVSSSWSEGLGTSVLEALACETPVVATVAGGVPEMVQPDQTGFLVPSRDPAALARAIVESLTHRDKAREMARQGRQRVIDRFGVDRMVEDTLQAYTLVLQDRTIV